MIQNLVTSTTISPIGLDIGSRSVKAVQLRRRGETLQMASAVEFARSSAGVYPDEEEAAKIEGVLYRRGFAGSRVSIAVPRALAMFEEIERPPRGEGVPVEQIVRAELARVRRVDPAALEHAWWELPSESRRVATTAMVLGTERAPLGEVVANFERAGLAVVGVEPALTALVAAAGLAGIAGDPFTVVADVGWGGLSLGVVHRGVLVYQRASESCGLRSVAARAASMGRVEPDAAVELVREAASGAAPENGGVRRALEEHANALAAEVEVSLGYASHRFRRDAGGVVALCGGGALLEGVRARVEAIASCSAVVLRPGAFAGAGAGGIREITRDTPAFTLACALAARFDA